MNIYFTGNRELKSTFEHIELPEKLQDYFAQSNKSNINQLIVFMYLFAQIFYYVVNVFKI